MRGPAPSHPRYVAGNTAPEMLNLVPHCFGAFCLSSDLNHVLQQDSASTFLIARSKLLAPFLLKAYLAGGVRVGMDTQESYGARNGTEQLGGGIWRRARG